MADEPPSLSKVVYLILDGLGLACMFSTVESCAHADYWWGIYQGGWGSFFLFFGVMGSKMYGRFKGLPKSQKGYYIALMFGLLVLYALVGFHPWIKASTPQSTDSTNAASITSTNQGGGFTGINTGTVNIAPILKGDDGSANKIIANQNESKSEIIEEMRSLLRQKNASLRDQLHDQFPNGYVLFGGKGDVSLPFPNGDMRVDADWSDTKILINTETKQAHVTLKQPTWEGSNIHIEVTEAAEWYGAYSVGVPAEIRFVEAAGQPKMYFEVLDENSEIYVIGFRKE